MADLSNSSNISSHEKLLEEYRRECDWADERLRLSCYYKTEGGVIKIKKWTPPSTIDLLKEVQSSDTLSDALSELVQYLIDQEDSSVPVPVVQKSAIEELANNSCKDLPIYDVAGQDTIRPSQTEIVKPNSPSKCTETNSSTSTLGRQQNKGKGAGCTATGLTSSSTCLTTSSRVSQNKSKPKMIKLKKPDISV